MSAEHTPGPWEISQTSTYEEALVAPKSGRTVAYAAWDGGSGCHLAIENDADARLIAAAPDLLEVLEMAIIRLEKLTKLPEASLADHLLLQKARITLSLATGERK